MQKPDEYGNYQADVVEEVARHGRSFAEIAIAQCEDGLYRYAISMNYSYGGFGGPITEETEGLETLKEARIQAMAYFIEHFPRYHPYEPASVEAELREMKAQIRNRLLQPTLF